MTPGAICHATLVGGLGHDQGTRPWLVIGRAILAERTGETLVLPISHVAPDWDYPLSWPLPDVLLGQQSWVLISRPRAAAVNRLRGPVAHVGKEDLESIVLGLQQLLVPTR